MNMLKSNSIMILFCGAMFALPLAMLSAQAFPEEPDAAPAAMGASLTTAQEQQIEDSVKRSEDAATRAEDAAKRLDDAVKQADASVKAAEVARKQAEDRATAAEAAQKIAEERAAAAEDSEKRTQALFDEWSAAKAEEEARQAEALRAEEARRRAYTVKSGDTLSNIAAGAYKDSSQWQRIYEANRDRLTDPDNPHLIYPGQIIDVPDKE